MNWKKRKICFWLLWRIVSDPFVEFVIIGNKCRHSFQPNVPIDLRMNVFHQLYVCLMQNVTQHVNIWPLCLFPLSSSLIHYLASLLHCFSLSLSFSLHPSSNFRNFPQRVVVLKPMQTVVLLFSPLLVSALLTNPISYFLHLKTPLTKIFLTSKTIFPSFPPRGWLPPVIVHLKSDLLTFQLIMRPFPPILSPLSPRNRRKRALVTQRSVEIWRGPLLQSHGRLQALMRPCELYFLTRYICPEAGIVSHRT